MGHVLPALLLAGGPALLLLGAALPGLRPVAALALAAGWAGLRLGRRGEAIAWAAALPVGVGLTAPWVLGSDVALGDPACTVPLSAIVVRRLVACGVVAGLVVALAAAHRSGAAELGLRRPSAPQALLAAGGLVGLAAGGLVVGPLVARPFFGELSFAVPPAVVVPALVFGVANGVTEELAYRGAMQAWLGRVAAPWAAIGYQGLVFGVIHLGPEVVSLLPLHVALLAGVGVAAGLVRARTGSLLVPAAIHVGADIALYVGLACRAAA